MNKRQIISSLNKIANELDNSGHYKESNEIVSVMQKLAMPISRNQHGAEEISESINRFNVSVQRLEDNLELFDRFLRVIDENIYDRNPDYEEVFNARRKLQNTFEEIKNDSVRLNYEMREIKSLSSMIQNSNQESGQQNSKQMSQPAQIEGELMSDSESDANMNNTSPISKLKRTPFTN